MSEFVKKALIFLIKSYQAMPRRHRGCCRFTPTCSQYAIEAVEIHGVIKGGLLAVWRILRCNPFCKGGWDPVPLKQTKEDNNR